VATDGAAALNYLAGAAEGPPQLILLDLGLPKIDGFEVLRQIKAEPRTRNIPVIVLTASNRSKDIVTCQRLGAAGYIVKPVDFQNLCVVTPQLSLQWALLAGGKSDSAPAS